MESASSGILCGINAALAAKGKKMISLPPTTMMGALISYITTPAKNFQPMSANYAIIAPAEQRFTDKKLRNTHYAERSFEKMQTVKQELGF